LVAAWWQISRSDNVAQKIRRAERYESALIELNARVAETVGRLGKVWNDAKSASLRGLSQEDTDASEYGRAREPLNELLNHWFSVSSLLISDTTIVEAFVRLHQESATHIWHEDSRAYSRQPPIDGKVDTIQFLQDLETVYVAVSEAGEEVRLRVAALHDAPRSLLRTITATARRNASTSELSQTSPSWDRDQQPKAAGSLRRRVPRRVSSNASGNDAARRWIAPHWSSPNG
jgi:hypothetical protein